MWQLLLGPIGGLLAAVYALGVLSGFALVMRFYVKMRIDAMKDSYDKQIASMKGEIESLKLRETELLLVVEKWTEKWTALMEDRVASAAQR